MDMFSQNSDWTKEIMAEVAEHTGLSENQVYKWCWDQKRKQEEEEALAAAKAAESGVKRKLKAYHKLNN